MLPLKLSVHELLALKRVVHRIVIHHALCQRSHSLSPYLHVLLVILLFQLKKLLGSLAGFLDLLHGSLVLKLKQADSISQLHYVFLNPEVLLEL